MHTWPFEGRETELARIDSMYTGPDADAVVLTGPAGSGKTRLARQILSSLDGARTVWIGATRAAASIPFGAIAPLLPDEGPIGAPVQVMRAVARQVGRWGGRQRVAVAVDDADLLDDGSATVIAHLVDHGLVFAVLTARSGEPLADVLVRLAKDQSARRIELAPLPEEVVDRLIDHTRPDGVGARERRKLHRVAAGNPLALRELLIGAQPGGLGELITERLNGLTPGVRHAVELVACGEPLSVSILERLAGSPALIAAEDAGLIATARSGARVEARLAHPLYGEVLRSGMGHSRSRRVYRVLVGALLDTPLRRRDDTLLVAVWQVEAGRILRPDLVRIGARRAVDFADLDLAERLARAARAAEPGHDADRLLAEILAHRGRTAEAARLLAQAPPADTDDPVAWAVTRSRAVYWSSGDIEAALDTLSSMAGHPSAEASRTWILFYHARCAEAFRIARDVLDRPESDPTALIWASASGAATAGFLGRGADADKIAERGSEVAAAHRESLPWGSVQVKVGACLADLAGGMPAAAQAITDDGYRQALQGSTAMMVSAWALYGGIVALAQGHLDHAERLLVEAQPGFEANDTSRLSKLCLAARAGAAAQRGDRTAAELMASAIIPAHPSNRVFGPWVGTWRAWTCYADGDLAAAAASATDAADLAREFAMPVVEALALYEVARFGNRADLDRLGGIDHEFAELARSAARALALRDGAADLATAAADFEERGYDLHAAELYATAAHRDHRHGRIAPGSLNAADAARLAERVGPAHTPLLRPDGPANSLTRREREILLLATEHTSPQIADHLGLALTTVNNNLARAYSKLGINSRSQLRALLNEQHARPDQVHETKPAT